MGRLQGVCLCPPPPPTPELFAFRPSDIDPVSVTPVEPQVVMLGDKVEWQCKTKGSAPHTVQWKKVCAPLTPTSPLMQIEFFPLLF